MDTAHLMPDMVDDQCLLIDTAPSWTLSFTPINEARIHKALFFCTAASFPDWKTMMHLGEEMGGGGWGVDTGNLIVQPFQCLPAIPLVLQGPLPSRQSSLSWTPGLVHLTA